MMYLEAEEDFSYRIPNTEPSSDKLKRVKHYKDRAKKELGSIVPASRGNTKKKHKEAKAGKAKSDRNSQS